MNIFSIFIFIFITLIVCQETLSQDVFDSNFIDVNIKTLNANETKLNSINEVKYITLMKLADKILNNKSKKKFNRIIQKYISTDQLTKNIIIENEIITNEKYIAKIKINLNKQKIVDLLRNNKINYTDIQSEPFLVISSYNINFINIGLDKKKSFNNFLKHKVKNEDDLLNFFFPNLDANDRYILPYEKIIKEDKDGFDSILKKYNLNNVIFIKILKSNVNNLIDVNILIYDNENFLNIGSFNLNDINFESQNELLDFISNKFLIYMNEWWKKEYQINNSEFNIIECKILSKSFKNLIKIYSNINNLSQVKHIKTKKIQLNSNIIEIFYYGNLNVLFKSLSLSNNFYKNINGCIISN